jgi:hypothetical protein
MHLKDIKKGTRVYLRNGWEATVQGNTKQNTVVCEVYGFCTESGSVYGHDIIRYQDDQGNWHDITGYQPCQIRCRERLKNSPF